MFSQLAFCFCKRHFDLVAVWASSGSFARLHFDLAGGFWFDVV